MKLNTAIAQRLAPEYVMLWQASKEVAINDGNLRRLLQDKVARARRDYLAGLGNDTLSSKLEAFGNTGGWGLHQVQELAAVVFKDKRPDATNLGNWLSIEIELLMPNKAAEATFVSFVRKSGYMKAVTIKDDGSIKRRQCECDTQHDDEGNEIEDAHDDDCQADERTAYGREIVITFQDGDWALIKALCDKLNKIGCKVNKSCGLHVHFDMRHITTARKVSVIAQRVAKVVPALKQMLPASRQDNEYCSRVINRHSDSDNSRYGRYAFVNVKAYERHQTLEIRGHSGTTDANKIINWIKILRIVMAKPNRSAIATVQAMIEKFNFDAELQTYMLSRQAKFARAVRQSDDVSSDNQAAESGQAEIFSIGAIGDTFDGFSISGHTIVLDTETASINDNGIGRGVVLTEESIRQAAAMISANHNEEVA